MEKQHHSDRFRGGIQFIERWTNAKAAFIGFLAGRGYSSAAIAEALGDGTTPATIRRLWRKWHLPKTRGFVVVPMGIRERANTAARAAQHDLTIEEYCRRMLVRGSMPRDRYKDIVGEWE